MPSFAKLQPFHPRSRRRCEVTRPRPGGLPYCLAPIDARPAAIRAASGKAGSGRPAAQVIRRNYPKHSQGFTWVHSGISRATLMVSGRPIEARSL